MSLPVWVREQRERDQRAEERAAIAACPDPSNLAVYTDSRGRLAFGARTGALVLWLERAFPSGLWTEDPDGTPYYLVPALRHLGAHAVLTPNTFGRKGGAS